MRTITVSEGQTLLDIAMQYCGDASVLFDIADLNGLEVTDDLVPGQQLLVPDAEIDKQAVADAFSDGIIPSSTDDNIIPVDEGIEFWAIEDDFIVS
ncbi:MAG: LysM peptidoglycan-binding domain-containing protein [Ginsengibacter sp.]